MSWKTVLFILAATAMLSGCVTFNAARGHKGKAYVVDGSIFGTGMLNCDATDGNPECWPVAEQER